MKIPTSHRYYKLPHSSLQTYYFRMWFSLIIAGALHGLVLLPVILSLAGGPGFPMQEADEEWMATAIRSGYEYTSVGSKFIPFPIIPQLTLEPSVLFLQMISRSSATEATEVFFINHNTTHDHPVYSVLRILQAHTIFVLSLSPYGSVAASPILVMPPDIIPLVKKGCNFTQNGKIETTARNLSQKQCRRKF